MVEGTASILATRLGGLEYPPAAAKPGSASRYRDLRVNLSIGFQANQSTGTMARNVLNILLQSPTKWADVKRSRNIGIKLGLANLELHFCRYGFRRNINEFYKAANSCCTIYPVLCWPVRRVCCGLNRTIQRTADHFPHLSNHFKRAHWHSF